MISDYIESKMLAYVHNKFPKVINSYQEIRLMRHVKGPDSYEYWEFFDKNDKRIYFFDIKGNEICTQYNKNGTKKSQFVYNTFTPVRMINYDKKGENNNQNRNYEKIEFDESKNWERYIIDGTRITMEDSEGHHAIIEKDIKGQVIHTRDRYENEKWYSYDKHGNLIGEKHCNGYERIYRYNEKNRLIKIEGIINGEWQDIPYNIDNAFYDNVKLEHCDIVFEIESSIESKDLIAAELDAQERLIYLKNLQGYELWQQFDFNPNAAFSKNKNVSNNLNLVEKTLFYAILEDRLKDYLKDNSRFEWKWKDNKDGFEHFYADGKGNCKYGRNIKNFKKADINVKDYCKKINKAVIEDKILEGVVKILLFRGFYHVEPVETFQSEFISFIIGRDTHRISSKTGSKGENILIEVKQLLSSKFQSFTPEVMK